jgi:hypothetical protein
MDSRLFKSAANEICLNSTRAPSCHRSASTLEGRPRFSFGDRVGKSPVAISMVQTLTRHAAAFFCAAAVLNVGFLCFGLEFVMLRSRTTARRLLAASIVYLPLLFVLYATLCNRVRI